MEEGPPCLFISQKLLVFLKKEGLLVARSPFQFRTGGRAQAQSGGTVFTNSCPSDFGGHLTTTIVSRFATTGTDSRPAEKIRRVAQ